AMRLLFLLAASSFLVSCAPHVAPTPEQAAARAAIDTVKPLPPIKALITVRNLSERDIMVGVRGPETQMISIPMKAKRTISLPPGTYKWAATAEKTETQVGNKAFEAGQQYVWDFNLD
ncbi:MAG: hypothetical protein QNL77_08350, partial [Akkermansiaceae bacterium]